MLGISAKQTNHKRGTMHETTITLRGWMVKLAVLVVAFILSTQYIRYGGPGMNSDGSYHGAQYLHLSTFGEWAVIIGCCIPSSRWAKWVSHK